MQLNEGTFQLQYFRGGMRFNFGEILAELDGVLDTTTNDVRHLFSRFIFRNLRGDRHLNQKLY